MQDQPRHKKITTHLYLKNGPQPKNPQRAKSKLLTFQINSSKQHKRNTSHTSLQNNGLINKISTTLNHPYPMKIALIKMKPQETEEKRIGTHLTIIGVCTTTFPEKSGT